MNLTPPLKSPWPQKHSEKVAKLMHSLSRTMHNRPKDTIMTLDFALMLGYTVVYCAALRLARGGQFGFLAALMAILVLMRIDREVSAEFDALVKLLDQTSRKSFIRRMFAYNLGFLVAMLEGPARLPVISAIVDWSVPIYVFITAMIYAARYSCEYDAKTGSGGGV